MPQVNQPHSLCNPLLLIPLPKIANESRVLLVRNNKSRLLLAVVPFLGTLTCMYAENYDKFLRFLWRYEYILHDLMSKILMYMQIGLNLCVRVCSFWPKGGQKGLPKYPWLIEEN